MTESLTISQLAERCRAESERYQQQGVSDETFCFELFRLALTEQHEAAWQAIYQQYHALVASWVQRHSRFSEVDEATDLFVNEAFARMWRAGTRPERAQRLAGLGPCLGYLKQCTWSAVEDHLRKQAKDALQRSAPLETFDPPGANIEARVHRQLYLDQINRILQETIQDEAERIVAEESWVYGLTPRQIQADHAHLFATVRAVNQIKRNLLKRLRRRIKNRVGD